jgi:hypothetical protein
MIYTKTIDRIERLSNSRNGNPAYRLHFTDGTSARTQSDASISYVVDGPEFRRGPVAFTTTKAGRIFDASPVK